MTTTIINTFDTVEAMLEHVGTMGLTNAVLVSEHQDGTLAVNVFAPSVAVSLLGKATNLLVPNTETA